jgi:hypothetical protein
MKQRDSRLRLAAENRGADSRNVQPDGKPVRQAPKAPVKVAPPMMRSVVKGWSYREEHQTVEQVRVRTGG